MKRVPDWTPEEDRAVLDIVDGLKASNPDTYMKEIFPLAAELYNEKFDVKRTVTSLANHYYYLVREGNNEDRPRERHKVRRESEDTAPQFPSSNEVNELVVHVTAILGKFEGLKSENDKLMAEHARLEEENNRLLQELAEVKTNYDSLMRVINTARQLAVDEEVSISAAHRKFRMEQNGNLVTA